MTTRRNLIKTLCASVMLAPFAKASENYSPKLEKWAIEHATRYAYNFFMANEIFIDKQGRRYVSTWPINFAQFMMKESGQRCKMVIEFPKNIRQTTIPDHPSKTDIAKAKQKLFIQIKPFMIEYAKKQMVLHPEICAELIA